MYHRDNFANMYLRASICTRIKMELVFGSTVYDRKPIVRLYKERKKERNLERYN